MADPRAEPHWRSAVDVPLIVLATATVLSLVRSIDQPEFLARARRQRGHFRAHRRGARGARGVLRARGCSAAAACPGRRAPSPIAAAAFARLALPLVRRERRPTRSSLPSSCSSTACSRSASCSSCGDGCSSGCSSACWSPSPSSRSATACSRFFDAPFVESRVPRAAPAVVPRRARSRGALDDDARARARGAVHTRFTDSAACRSSPGSPERSASSSARRSQGCSALYLDGRRDRRGRDRARRGDEARRRADRGRDRRDHDRRARTPLRRPGGVPPLDRDRRTRGTIPSPTAASWNERLIDAYIGGRIFLENPILGTGWHGAAAAGRVRALHRRCAARASPTSRRATFRPWTGSSRSRPTTRCCTSSGSSAPFCSSSSRSWSCGPPRASCASGRATIRDELAAYLPAAWVGALAGGLAGAALFGGIPLAAIFWLTIGVAALAPSLAPSPPTAVSLSIVHVIARLNVGGAALHVLQLAHEQARRGHDVVVVAGTLAAGEESMEYVADELGVRAR